MLVAQFSKVLRKSLAPSWQRRIKNKQKKNRIVPNRSLQSSSAPNSVGPTPCSFHKTTLNEIKFSQNVKLMMFNDVAYKASGFLENGKPKSKFCNENRTHDARNTLVFVVKTSYQGNNFLSWRVGKSSSRQEENAN